jgi:hypothetical protein
LIDGTEAVPPLFRGISGRSPAAVFVFLSAAAGTWLVAADFRQRTFDRKIKSNFAYTVAIVADGCHSADWLGLTRAR